MVINKMETKTVVKLVKIAKKSRVSTKFATLQRK